MSHPATSSGLKSASGVISANPGRLMALQVIPGAADATVTIYDAATATGTVLAKVVAPTAGGSVSVQLPEDGVLANTAIYADISGTGAACVVSFTIS